MPELTFRIAGTEPIRAAAGPMLGLDLEVVNSRPEEPVQTIVLNCQIHIEASRRRYDPDEKDRLRDLFGEPERWGETLRPLLWTNLTTTVPTFSDAIGVQLAVPCPFDFDLTAAKYFHAVDETGTVPITVLFSGTVFYRARTGQLQAGPIPWNTEARFAFPNGVWKKCIELCYPNRAWLGLRRDVFERLYEFKVREGLATFDDALEQMMSNALKVGA